MAEDPAPPYPIDRASLEQVTDVAFFVAGGPGGQHRNKVATGVRLTHRPSGLTVTATERRSQAVNREVAFARLAARLMAVNTPVAPRVATQVGRAQRKQRSAAKRRRGQIKQLRRAPSDHERD
jgi:protein subunit release factor B